jgi:adenylate cyclase
MAEDSLVSSVAEWLIDQALSEPDIVEMFEGLCRRLHGIGIPLARARLTWPTLHPLFQAETILWVRGQDTVYGNFNHQDKDTPAWVESPMKFVLDNKIGVLRRRLEGPNKLIDFPLLNELVDIGLTDYLMITTNFSEEVPKDGGSQIGIIVTWSPDRKGGFTDSDISALKRIQRRFAVACKTAIQARIARNITTTYLGSQAGQHVLDGQIRRGDGQEINAVVWYSDLRNSTALADTMASDDYLDLLNAYYECTAGPAIEAGGEVLDFIGDAVLAIFPLSRPGQVAGPVRAATRAIRKSLKLAQDANLARKSDGRAPMKFGIGLNIGTVTFGNIGVPERLDFSVIGPTVNEVARIESQTKALDTPVLVSADIAAVNPDDWQSRGHHRLAGIAQKMELFAVNDDAAPGVLAKPATRRRTAGRRTRH